MLALQDLLHCRCFFVSSDVIFYTRRDCCQFNTGKYNLCALSLKFSNYLVNHANSKTNSLKLVSHLNPSYLFSFFFSNILKMLSEFLFISGVLTPRLAKLLAFTFSHLQRFLLKICEICFVGFGVLCLNEITGKQKFSKTLHDYKLKYKEKRN